MTFCNTTNNFFVKWQVRNKHVNSILIKCHYPDLGSAFDRSNFQPTRSTTKIWVLTPHQYGISAPCLQKSFSRETLGRGAKKIIFTACHLGKLKLASTSPNSFQLVQKAFWWPGFISQFFFNLNSLKNLTCPSGKLRTEFTSPKAKSGLSNTT